MILHDTYSIYMVFIYIYIYIYIYNVSLCVGEKHGYISDVSLKRRIHLDVSWENDPFDLYLIYKPYSDQLT